MSTDLHVPIVDYISLGAFTRDYQIAATGELLSGAEALGKLGGGGAYAMTGAHLWSQRVGIVGRRAEGMPQPWIERIQASGIDTRGLSRLAGVPVELVFGRYFPDGERGPYDPVKVFPSLNIPLSDEVQRWAALGHAGQIEIIRQISPNAEDIPEAYLAARAFHIAPMPWARQVEVVERLRQHGILVTLDPGPHFMNTIDSSDLARLLASVDIFLPSEAEVYAYFGPSAELSDCIRRFADLGPRVVVIKMSTRGSLVYERDHGWLHSIPAYPARTRDATGAGDSYCGGFMVGYDETGDARQAGLYGTVSASFVVEEPGALYSLAFDREAAEQRLVWLDQRTQSVAPRGA